MKTTTEIYEQERRIDKLLWNNTTSRIKEVHPATDGNLMLTGNWGNDKAKYFLKIHMERQSKLFTIFQKYYESAFINEYPQHNKAKKYKSKVS